MLCPNPPILEHLKRDTLEILKTTAGFCAAEIAPHAAAWGETLAGAERKA